MYTFLHSAIVNEPDGDTSLEAIPQGAFAPLQEGEDDDQFEVVSMTPYHNIVMTLKSIHFFTKYMLIWR